MSDLRRMLTTFPSTPPHSSNKGTDLTRTWTDPRPDSKERALDNFKENYSSFLAAGGGLSAEAMIFSTICNGKSPYERMAEQNQIGEYKARIAGYDLTFVSPQAQLQTADPILKSQLLSFVAQLDIIDIGHDAMRKLDCIKNASIDKVDDLFKKIFTQDGNFKPVIGKEKIISIINNMYDELMKHSISTFERPPSILVVKETIDDVMTKLEAEYNGGSRFVGFSESGRGITRAHREPGSIYSILDGGSSPGEDSPDIKRYCSEYGIVHIYARFIREQLYEIIQIVEDKSNYHCFVILATDEISLNQVLLAIHTYLNIQYESAERGAGFQGLPPTMKLIRYEKKVKSKPLDECAENIHYELQKLGLNHLMYEDIPELKLTLDILKPIREILECCLWALKSMGDKGGTIGFLLKQKEKYEHRLREYKRAIVKFSQPPVKSKCIMWTVDSFLAAIIPGYYYAGLIDEHPIVALSHAKGWDVCIPPSSDSTGYAISLYQLQTYNEGMFDFLKENYGFNHLEYVVHILFPSIRDTTHVSFFYRILRALLNNIHVYIKRKFNDYDKDMKKLKQDLPKFEGMDPQAKQAFLLRVPNELTLDFSSIVGKLLLLFFEFSQENEQETAQKIFNKIAALNRLNRFDEILGTKRTMNDLIGSNLDVLLSAFRHTDTPETSAKPTFLQFITPTEVMDTEGITATPSVLEEKMVSLKKIMGDKVFNDTNIHEVFRLLEKREQLYLEGVEELQKNVEKHSHLKENLVQSTTFDYIPRALEVRIETQPDTTFIYVRTTITTGGVEEYNKYLREMTGLEEEVNNFSIERIGVAFYIKFPINVQFLADFYDKYSTQSLSVYTIIRGEWGNKEDINVKPFCEREIRNILVQLFPSEVLTGDINTLLPHPPSTIFSRVVEQVKRALTIPPKQKPQKKPRKQQQDANNQSIESQIKLLTNQLIQTKDKTKINEIRDKLNLLHAEQQRLLKDATKKVKRNKGGRKTRRIRKKFTLKHKKRSMRKTQRRRNIIK